MSGPNFNPTVEGFRYESYVYGIDIGTQSYDSDYIFIPSKRLLVSDDGHVHSSEHPVESKKAKIVADQYIKECYAKKREYNANEHAALIGKADEEAREKVQVPLIVVDELNVLIQEKAELESKKEGIIIAISDIDTRISDLTKQLF